jgi:hypothetical protein
MPSAKSKRHDLVIFFRRKESNNSIVEQSKGIQSSTYNQAPTSTLQIARWRNVWEMERMWIMVTWTTFLDYHLKSKNKKLNSFCFSPTNTDPPCLLNIENVVPTICLAFLFTCLESGSWVLSYLQTPWGYKPLRLMKKWKKEFFYETLPIVNKPKHPKKKKKKRINRRNKMEGPMSKKDIRTT